MFSRNRQWIFCSPSGYLSWLVSHALLHPNSAGDLARLSCFQAELGLTDETKTTNPLMTLFQSAGWVFPFENICFVSERPTAVVFDKNGLLHCKNGPCVVYPDGFLVCCWHNVVVPPEWVENPSALSFEDALGQTDVLLRLVACEIIGWDKIVDRFEQQHINRPRNRDPKIGTLFSVELPALGKMRFLRHQFRGKGRINQVPNYEMYAESARRSLRRNPRIWMQLLERETLR